VGSKIEEEASRIVCQITDALRGVASEEEAEAVVLNHLSDEPLVNEIVYSRIDVVLALRRTAAWLESRE
jgi:hypothetical protein